MSNSENTFSSTDPALSAAFKPSLGYKLMSMTEMFDGDWFIGMMLGTNEYLCEGEKKVLKEKCEKIIIDFIDNEIDPIRAEHMINKARALNQGLHDSLRKMRTERGTQHLIEMYKRSYNDMIVKGHDQSSHDNVKIKSI